MILLSNDYTNIQSRFKQYIDYNQILDCIVSANSNSGNYVMQKAGLLGMLALNFGSITKTLSFPCVAPFDGLSKHLVRSYMFPVILTFILAVTSSYSYLRHVRHRVCGKLFFASTSE